MLIAGDIGGTKTDLAINSIESGTHRPLAETEVHSADYPNLLAVVTKSLAQAKMSVDVASFDVAGCVINRRAKTTNLPRVLDEATLAKVVNRKAGHLMNDLETVADAMPALRAEDTLTINQGDRVANGPIAILGPGTGLGESFPTWNGSQYVAHGSEGGWQSCPKVLATGGVYSERRTSLPSI